MTMRACVCSPAARAAAAVKRVWPPTEIQPVNQAAAEREDGGDRTETQWYCPPAVG